MASEPTTVISARRRRPKSRRPAISSASRLAPRGRGAGADRFATRDRHRRCQSARRRRPSKRRYRAASRSQRLRRDFRPERCKGLHREWCSRPEQRTGCGVIVGLALAVACAVGNERRLSVQAPRRRSRPTRTGPSPTAKRGRSLPNPGVRARMDGGDRRLGASRRRARPRTPVGRAGRPLRRARLSRGFAERTSASTSAPSIGRGGRHGGGARVIGLTWGSDTASPPTPGGVDRGRVRRACARRRGRGDLMQRRVSPATQGLLLGAVAGALFGVSDIAMKYDRGRPRRRTRARQPVDVAALIASVGAFFASARGLQLGPGSGDRVHLGCRQPHRDRRRHPRLQ